ncbi:hypothetical protein ACF0H5_010699 [Mactra antiquata]
MRGKYSKKSVREISGSNVQVPTGIYELNDKAKWLAETCDETFKPTLSENLEVIKNYPKGIAENYLGKIGGNKTKPDKMATFPVFVTAMDYAYYPFCQGMFKTVHYVLNTTKYRGQGKIIVYDLGLTKRQLRMLYKYCRCEIRKFPFDEFPPHVRDLKTYAFKPIIVLKTFMEFGFVWWLDISIKILTPSLDPALEYAKANSALVFVTPKQADKTSIAQQTDVQTFYYLREDSCKYKYYGEIDASMLLFHFDNISQAMVKAWATCALNEGCIAPVGKERLYCDFFDMSVGRCHRFDQSALGIIYRRLHHEQNLYPLNQTLRKIYFVGRREFFDYFEKCRYTFMCY